MTARIRFLIAGGALAVALLLGSCAGGPGPAGTGTRPAAAAEQAAAGEQAGGGEAAAVPFTHPALKWSVAAPGPMTVQGDGAAYAGRSDYLQVSVVAGAATAGQLAKADSAGTGVQGFSLVKAPYTAQIAGLTASLFEFTRADVVSPVTGKPQTAHVLRAYVPKAGGAFRLEYGATVPAADWDPQGALDILSTFAPAP